MKTRNAMQLKALIKSRSIEIGLTPQQKIPRLSRGTNFIGDPRLRGDDILSITCEQKTTGINRSCLRE